MKFTYLYPKCNHISRFSIYSQFLSGLCTALHSCKTWWLLCGCSCQTDRLTITAKSTFFRTSKKTSFGSSGFFVVVVFFFFRFKTMYQTYIFNATHHFSSPSRVILSLLGMSVCYIFHFFCFPVRKMQTSNHTNSACSAKTLGGKKNKIKRDRPFLPI